MRCVLGRKTYQNMVVCGSNSYSSNQGAERLPAPNGLLEHLASSGFTTSYSVRTEVLSMNVMSGPSASTLRVF